jgi:uncharacterized protein
MSAFIDTSALYAILDCDDANHRQAAAVWGELLAAGDTLVTSSYVVVESTALVQHRPGMDAVAALLRDLMPVVVIEWVTEADHREAMAALLAAGRRSVSLVDCVSFVIMRRMGFETAFAFGAHFPGEGFRTLGAGRSRRR